jgi:hypothetical protein
MIGLKKKVIFLLKILVFTSKISFGGVRKPSKTRKLTVFFGEKKRLK